MSRFNKTTTKTSLIIISILFIIRLNAQSCGTWIDKPVYYTEWETIEPLFGIKTKRTIRIWIYSKEQMTVSMWPNDFYSWQCGKGYPIKWVQYRICRINGIFQRRYKIQESYYIPIKIK